MKITTKEYEKLGRQFNSEKGKINEQLACDYLQKKKYKIIEKNYQNQLGEIDIIAKYKKIIVFVEVKYRKTAFFGLPQEAVNPYKQSKIRTCASMYLKVNDLLDAPIRFDVIAILGEEITHIENAF